MSWNRSTEPVKPVKKEVPPSMLKGIVGGLAAVVVCVAAFFIFSSGDEKPKGKSEKKTAAIKEVKAEALVVKRQSSVKTGLKHDSPEQAPKAEAVAQVRQRVPPPLTQKELESISNRVFKTATEQILSWICTTTPGEMPMPFPPIGPEDRKNLVSILISKSEVKPSDSEDVALVKEDVGYAKKELAKFIADGGDPDDFLQYYYKELRSAFERRQMTIAELDKIHESGDKDAAREFGKKANAILEEKGIKPIDFTEYEEDD